MTRFIYSEDGGEWVVELLSDTVDEEGLRCVELECVRELRPSPIFGSIRIGGIWTASCKPGWEHAVGWELEPYLEDHAAN